MEIQEPSSRRRVNSLPEVLPILNSDEPKTAHTDVSFSDSHFAKVFAIYGAKSNVFEGNTTSDLL